jgi:hypothetical protein
LTPDRIVCPTKACQSLKHLTIFLLLRQWKKADTVVQVSDYHRIIPLLDGWSDDTVRFSCCSECLGLYWWQALEDGQARTRWSCICTGKSCRRWWHQPSPTCLL